MANSKWIYVFVQFSSLILSILAEDFCQKLSETINYEEETCSNNYNARSICSFSCKRGFDKVGGGTKMVCWCAGGVCSWQGSPPQCEVSKCKHPDVYLTNVNVVNDWVDGFAGLVEIDTGEMDITNGWSVVIIFEQALGQKASLISWDARLTSVSFDKKTFTLSNAEYNRDLSKKSNKRNIRILFIVTDIGINTPRAGFIGLFQTQVKDATCLRAPKYNKFSPLPSFGEEKNKIDSTVPAEPNISIVQSTTPSTTTTTVVTTTTQPPTTTPAVTTTKTTTEATTKEPSTTSPPISTRASTGSTSSDEGPLLKKINGRFCVLQRQGTPYSTEAGWLDGGLPYFSGNAYIQPETKIMDWEMLMVFSEVILALEVWNCRVTGHSESGYMWTLGPLAWNTVLEPAQNDISFLAKQQAPTASNPVALVYLCSQDLLDGDVIVTGPGDKKFFEILPNASEMDKPTDSADQSWLTVKSTEQSDSFFRTDPTTPAPSTVSRKPVKMTERCKDSSPRGTPITNAQQTKPKWKPNTDGTKYNYNKVLHLSILFYEAQRSGILPKKRYKRIPWRGNSGLKDGCDIGVDLSKGWFDAGDHVKFNFPMASSVTNLAWGGVIFRDAYKDSGELIKFIGSIRWPVEYLIACHISKYELVGQIGNPKLDHSYWGRPEEMAMERKTYLIDENNPGSDLAAETAAALASSSIVLKKTHRALANSALKHAKELFEFADKFRGRYDDVITVAQGYYNSVSGYDDEMLWAAAWLYKASGDEMYLNKARAIYDEMKAKWYTGPIASWDHKLAAAQALLANITGEDIFRGQVINFMNKMMSLNKTPQGMIYYDVWAPNRYAANAAFIAMVAATLEPPLPKRKEYFDFGKKQIHLLLGDSGRSYVVGFGKNYPKKIHHRSSSCKPYPAVCTKSTAHDVPSPNHYILYGALVGGPSTDGTYKDDRTDYKESEVGCDYNAGFQSAVAGLKHFALARKLAKGKHFTST